MQQRHGKVIGCPSCGYNLAELSAHGTCPECGKRYRDLAPGKVLAFWTNRRIVWLLVLTPIAGAMVTLFMMAAIDRGIGVSQPGAFGMTLLPELWTGVGVVLIWQLPLVLLSSTAVLLLRHRPLLLMAYIPGAAVHLAVGWWGTWGVYSMHDAQAAVGIVFVPIYSGFAGWFIAIVMISMSLIAREIRRMRRKQR